MADQIPSPQPAQKWEGAEEWMPLAWELCANECGEEACTELIWEGGPIPEPWGDRWLKYEDQAKEMIAMVRASLAAVQAPDPVDGDVRELRKWLNEQPNRPVDRDALARLLHAFENAQPVGEIVTDCDGETVLGDEVSWRVGMPPAGTKLYAAPCAAVGEAPDHLELFKEASEWAETAKRKITPDMVELLGWLTGAANAWAEKVEDRAKAAIPAPEGAQLPPLPHPLLIAGGGQSWFNAEQMRAYARAALAAPAPQDSLDSAQPSNQVAMQAAPVALTNEQIAYSCCEIMLSEHPIDYDIAIGRAVIAEFCRVNGIPAPQTKEPKA